MTIKRYIAKCSTEYSIHLKLGNGNNFHLKFVGKNVLENYRFVDVSDPLVQKALEESKTFHSYYFLSEYQIPEPIAPSPNPEIEKVFQNSIEARDWMVKTFKVPQKNMPNKQAIVDLFEAKGYKIKFLID